MHINSPVTLESVPASRSSKTGRAVAISGRRTPSPARTSNASRTRGRSNARKCNARSPSSSRGFSIRCVEPAGNASPQRPNSLFCSSHASDALQRTRAFGGKLHFIAMLPTPRDSTRSSGRSAAAAPVARVASPQVTRGAWCTAGTRRRFGHRRLVRRGDYSSRRIQIAEAHCDRVRTNFPRRTRLPTAADIFDIDRALDSQAGAIILRPFAHIAAQQRRLVFSLRDAAAFEKHARRLHRLPSPCIETELLGNRNNAHGRATSRIL